MRLTPLCAGRPVAAIGPVTRDACLRAGLAVDVMPPVHTLPAMVEALVEHRPRIKLQGGGPDAVP